jgi:hypothetical protein
MGNSGTEAAAGYFLYQFSLRVGERYLPPCPALPQAELACRKVDVYVCAKVTCSILNEFNANCEN